MFQWKKKDSRMEKQSIDLLWRVFRSNNNFVKRENVSRLLLTVAMLPVLFDCLILCLLFLYSSNCAFFIGGRKITWNDKENKKLKFGLRSPCLFKRRPTHWPRQKLKRSTNFVSRIRVKTNTSLMWPRPPGPYFGLPTFVFFIYLPF